MEGGGVGDGFEDEVVGGLVGCDEELVEDGWEVDVVVVDGDGVGGGVVLVDCVVEFI